MFYNFPIIETITDVLPAIEGRDEFIVAERDGFVVINYNVGFEDTFTIDDNDLMVNYGRAIPKGVMRRECRGIIFYPDGRLMSRPFHKFFNVGEREETLMHNIDLSRPHVIMEKMDGSMIRSLDIHGNTRLGTKMGVTDTSNAAERIATGEQFACLRVNMLRGTTLLTEYVSPENRIVIEYDKPELVLLAARDNRTGDYLDLSTVGDDFPFRVVPTYGSVDGSLDEYIERQRGLEGREGDIIAVGNMRYKIKNDWYVRIHKVKDKIRTDRHILALLLENELDDVYPHLDENDFRRVKLYEAAFHEQFKETARVLTADVGVVTGMAEDKKDLAVNIVPKSTLNAFGKQLAFRVYDRLDAEDFDIVQFVNDELMKYVRSKLGNGAKYNEMAELMGLPYERKEEDE